ncbi:MAG: RluA family pseudouridine synthase [Thermoleophilia bacterium]
MTEEHVNELHVTVSAEDDGSRLDVVLGGHPAVGTRSQAAVLMDAGVVTVDGRPRPKSFRVAAGQIVLVALPSEREDVAHAVAGGPTARVVFEDSSLLVADKPAGMVVHPARGHAAGTLVDALRGHGIAGGESFRPGIVHRLDKGTSGLLVVAKDVGVHRLLQEMIRERRLERRYLALVHGDIVAPTGTIEAPIGRDRHRRKTMTVGGVAAREAVTHFSVLERLGDFTLVEARLETGRTHQIRVHFLAIGHPVVGDPTYARRDVAGLGRQFLHSHSLEFEHPVTGESVSARSPLPPDLAGVLERLSDTRGGRLK